MMTDVVSESLTLGSAWTPFSAASVEPRRFTFEHATGSPLVTQQTIAVNDAGEVIIEQQEDPNSNNPNDESHLTTTSIQAELSKTIQDVLSDEMTRLDEVIVKDEDAKATPKDAWMVQNTSSILTCSTCSHEQNAETEEPPAQQQQQDLGASAMSDDSSVLHLLDDPEQIAEEYNDGDININRMAVEEEHETIWIERQECVDTTASPKEHILISPRQHAVVPQELSAALATLQENEITDSSPDDAPTTSPNHHSDLEQHDEDDDDHFPGLAEAPSDELEHRNTSPPQLQVFTKQSLYVRMRCNQRFHNKGLKENPSDESIATSTKAERSMSYFKSRYAQESKNRTLRSKESLKSVPSDEVEEDDPVASPQQCTSTDSTSGDAEKAREPQSSSTKVVEPPAQNSSVEVSTSISKEDCIMTPTKNIPTTRSLQVLDEDKLAKLLGFFADENEAQETLANTDAPCRQALPPVQEESSSSLPKESAIMSHNPRTSPQMVIKTPRSQDEAVMEKKSDQTDTTAALSLCDSSRATVNGGGSSDNSEPVQEPSKGGRRRSVIVTNPEIFGGDEEGIIIRPHTHASAAKTPHTIGSFSMLSPSFTEHNDMKNSKGPFFESRKASSKDASLFHEFFSFWSCSGPPPSPAKRLDAKPTPQFADV